MSSVPAQPPDQASLLRQQVILAQVRIMELEDVGMELAARREELEKLLHDAQTYADRQVEVCAHLEGVHSELQQQLAHLRHVQHVTQSALEATRTQLAAAENAGRTSEESRARLESDLTHARAEAQTFARDLAASQMEVIRQTRRIAELEAERRAMQSSRSWRWTAWVRSVERFFRRSR